MGIQRYMEKTLLHDEQRKETS